ncbi:GGDEF domain-containing protein [Vibrio sp. 99-8-1]|nr:GGDEF domain-containing protein [Vibrio sp. 99-8-1]
MSKSEYSMEISEQLQRHFFESFPGFLSIRDEQHRFVFINENFMEWIAEYTDANPMGKTAPEFAKEVPDNVAEMLNSCHDESLRFLSLGECLPKILKFAGHKGDQFFEIIKFKQQVDDGEFIFTTGFDVTKLHVSAKLYKQKSLTCGLTGLRNQRALVEKLEGNPEFSGVVIAIDLDRFKQINDENGHIKGDRALKSFSRILVDTFRKRDFIARVGGDEFLVICEDLVSKTSVMHRIGLLEDKFTEVFGEKYPYLNWSWGSVEHTGHLREAIDMADKIMYQHKHSRL